MTDRSTDRSDPGQELILQLLESASHYYLKLPAIQEKIVWNERTFYSKFRRIDRSPLSDLEDGRLAADSRLYLPLLEEGKGRYLAIEYSGADPKAFLQALEYLGRHLETGPVIRLTGDERGAVFLVTAEEKSTADTLHRLGEKFSRLLATRFQKAWKILPDPAIPESYNVYPLSALL